MQKEEIKKLYLDYMEEQNQAHFYEKVDVCIKYMQERGFPMRKFHYTKKGFEEVRFCLSKDLRYFYYKYESTMQTIRKAFTSQKRNPIFQFLDRLTDVYGLLYGPLSATFEQYK